MNKLLNICLFLLPGIFLAQQTAIYTDELADFQHAVSLYNNKSYQAAQTIFTQIKNTTSSPAIESDCAYYIANTAIRLNQPSAETLMEQFVEEYPTSARKNSAFLEVGYYYFEIGKYPQALKWLDKVSESSVSYSDKDKYLFQKGYAYFQGKNKGEAKKILNRWLPLPNTARKPSIIWDIWPTKAMITARRISILIRCNKTSTTIKIFRTIKPI